jgi:hypothetical protein
MNNISSRLTRAQLDAEMPLRQYFLFVGGALLALLFVANWLVQASSERTVSAVNFPPIRIHSDRKGPEAVVIDTSKSMLAPMPAVHEDVVTPQAVNSKEAVIDDASAPSETRMSQQTEASEQTKTREDRTTRQVAEARKERRTVGGRKSLSSTGRRPAFEDTALRSPKSWEAPAADLRAKLIQGLVIGHKRIVVRTLVQWLSSAN